MGKGRHVHTVLLAYSGRAAGGLAAARTNQGTRTHAGEGCARCARARDTRTL